MSCIFALTSSIFGALTRYAAKLVQSHCFQVIYRTLGYVAQPVRAQHS